MKVIIASKNPTKVNSAQEAFSLLFPDHALDYIQCEVESGVSNQPMSDTETFTGASNRVSRIQEIHPDADYWVGMEGGLEEKDNELYAFAWMVVASKDGKIGKGRTAVFVLPHEITKLVKEGKELGEASDIIFNETNSKHNQGTIGILTNNHIDRTKYYVHAMIMALIPFLKPDLYR